VVGRIRQPVVQAGYRGGSGMQEEARILTEYKYSPGK